MKSLNSILTSINENYLSVTNIIENKYNFCDEPNYWTNPDTTDFDFFGWADVVFIDSNGKILVAGQSGLYSGDLGDNYTLIKRFNVNGTLDETFTSPEFHGNYNGFVRDIKEQSDGKLVVVGHFTYIDGNQYNRIVRLNSDGSIDNTFNIGSGFGNNALVCHIDGDDNIFVGGSFNSYDGTSVTRLCKLGTDGSIDATFAGNVSFNNHVFAINTDGSGGLYAGGQFSNRIVKLDYSGNVDGAFNVGSGFDDRVSTIQIQNNGKLIVGGWFNSYDGTSCNPGIVRLNTDGTIDGTFASEGTGLNNWDGFSVQVAKIQSDGKVLAGGWFIGYNDTYQKAIVRLNSDGTRDNSFVTGKGFSDRVQDIAIDANGNIFVAGMFYYYDGQACPSIFNYLDSKQSGGVVKLNSTGKMLGTSPHQDIMPVGIDDGGDDMFDGGLYINTDVNQSYGSINESDSLPSTHSVMFFCDASEGINFALYDISTNDYTYDSMPEDGTIEQADSYFGTGSTYFTNMYPGLFVMGAKDISIDQISLTGGTGKDGDGDSTYGQFDVAVYGQTYGVFYKTCYNGSSGEPNIQQMIIVEGGIDGITHDIYDQNESMDQVLNGLTGRNKVFLLVFAINGLSSAYSEETFNSIAVEFLNVAMYEAVTFCPPTVCETPGLPSLTKTACVCSKSRLFAPNCSASQQNANLCSVANAAYVPAITVCRQKLF